MEHRLDKQMAMRVFMKILEHGEKVEGGHLYDGVLAESAEDDYSIRLSCDGVSLDLFFHNKYRLDRSGKKDFNTLIKRLQKIDQRL